MVDRQKSKFCRALAGKISLPDFINELMFGILLESAMAVFVLLLAPSALLPIIFLLTGGLFFFWLLKHLADKIWHVLLPAFFLVAGPLLFGGLPVWPRAIFSFAMLILAVRAFSKRLHPPSAGTEAPPFANTIAALGWLLLINLIAAWQNLTVLVMASFYLGIVYLLLSVFRRHRMSLTARLARFVQMESQPTGRIKRFNHILLLIFSGILALTLLLAPALHLETVIPWLASIILLGLRQLIQWLQSLAGSGDGPGPSPEPSPSPEPTEPGGLPPVPGEPAAWLIVLQQIFYYLVLAGTAVLLLGLIIVTIYSIYRRFYQSRSNGSDVLEVLLPEFMSDIRQNIRRSRKAWAQQFGRSPEQKIRRYYYRLVDDLIRHGLNLAPGDTPRDILEQIESGNRPMLSELTQIYEKARYGPDLCTIEDARRMLELSRRYRQKQEYTPDG